MGTPSEKECTFWKVHIDTFDKCTKMFKTVMFLIANFDPEVYEILVIFRIGGMYIQRSTYDELIYFFVRKVFSIF